MKATIELDTVLDLLSAHQDSLADRIDQQIKGTGSHYVLWDEYKCISGLYDDIRRAAE